MDGLTKRINLSLTLEEFRDIEEMITAGEVAQRAAYKPNDYITITQVLRPSRTATTVLLPTETVFVKVGGKASSRA